MNGTKAQHYLMSHLNKRIESIIKLIVVVDFASLRARTAFETMGCLFCLCVSSFCRCGSFCATLPFVHAVRANICSCKICSGF